MLAKYWKKIGLTILIIACLFNVVYKLVHRVSFFQELQSAVHYMVETNNNKK